MSQFTEKQVTLGHDLSSNESHNENHASNTISKPFPVSPEVKMDSTSSITSSKSNSPQIVNYTIEKLLNSPVKPALPATPPPPPLATTLFTCPSFYDYRSFISYSNVGSVWKYFLPHHTHAGGNTVRQSRGPRRQRTTFTQEQTLRLEMEYHVAEYISRGKRYQLADLLDLTENQVKIWFQNRRAKDKRIEKAIVEQQYRYIAASSLSKQINLSNCSTCNYTKHQFESSVASGNMNIVENDGKEGIVAKLKVKSE